MTKNLDTLPDEPERPRPRTRARVKQEEEERTPSRRLTRALAKQEKDKPTNLTPNQKVGSFPRRRKEPSRPGPSQDPSKRPGQGRPQSTLRTSSRPQTKSSPIVSQAAEPKRPKETSQSQSKRPSRGRPQGTLRKSSRPEKKSSPIVLQAAEPKGPKETRWQVDTVAAKGPQQRRSAARGQFAHWLDQVELIPPGGIHQAQTLYTTPIPGVVYESRENMDSSSTSRNTKDNESTAKGGGTKSLKVSEAKLRLRRVNRDSDPDSPDERLPYLDSIVKTELPERLLRDTEELQRTMKDFLQLTADRPDENCYPFIDDFSFNIDEVKSKIDYPIVNSKYFQADLRRCLARNEAILQRTVMIHIINQYWLGKVSDWNCEGQWSLPKDSRLPSRQDDDVSLPKPDLAISFTLKSFTGEDDDSDPIPSDLEKCISPDGGSRCFPFLFMEVKKAGSDLQDAHIANLHSASQALFNMYLWMVRAGKAETFFKIVRVFSFVFNAQDLGVRVHRACQLADGNVGFRFDEFSPLGRYSKDQACLLVKTILNNYAAQELHRELKAAFTEVVKQEDERVISKRKNNPPRDVGPSKRPRRGQNATQHTGQSFAIGNLAT